MTDAKLSPREEEQRIAEEYGFEITGLKSDLWARSYVKGMWFMWQAPLQSRNGRVMGWQTAKLEDGRYQKHRPFTGEDAMKRAMERINVELVVEQTWGTDMSYDVSVGDASFNYTSNMAEFFSDMMPEREEGEGEGGRADRTDGLWALDGLTGKEAVKKLEGFFENVSRESARLCKAPGYGSGPAFEELGRKYDPENGWGCTGSAMVMMGRLMAACARNKKKRVWVSA